MSFRGGRGGRGGGGFRGGRGGGGRGGGGRGGFNNRDRDMGPPDRVEEVGVVSHPCQDELVLKCTHSRVPYFNAPVYMENKEQVGKIDEILGPITDYYFSVKLSENMKASSFKKLQKLFIDPAKTLPLDMFTNPKSNRGRGGGRGGRGGRGGGGGGGGRGGRGGGFSPRGGRGGFSPRGGRGGFSPRGGGGGGRGFTPRGGRW